MDLTERVDARGARPGVPAAAVQMQLWRIDLFTDWKKGNLVETDSATFKQGQNLHTYTQIYTFPITI